MLFLIIPILSFSIDTTPLQRAYLIDADFRKKDSVLAEKIRKSDSTISVYKKRRDSLNKEIENLRNTPNAIKPLQ